MKKKYLLEMEFFEEVEKGEPESLERNYTQDWFDNFIEAHQAYAARELRKGQTLTLFTVLTQRKGDVG